MQVAESSRQTSHRELRQRERRPNQVHVAVAVQRRVSSKVVKLRCFLKEGFHFSGGLGVKPERVDEKRNTIQ